MKKLLAVLLVLGFASSVASAAIMLDPATNGVVLQPSDTITLPIINTGTPLLGMDVIVTVEGPGSIVGAQGKAGAAQNGWDSGFSFDARQLENGVELGAGNFNGNGNELVGWVTFHCDGEGLVIVSIAAGDGFGGNMTTDFTTPEVGGSIEIIQIPEPMTMSLLGLGGLALIRRRRA